ncbi:MAG: polymorphic toxin type 15 domain-containing protein [Paracoccaceae bacterium]
MIDLIKALKGKIDELAEGVTNGITRITRRSGKRVKDPADMPCFNRPPNSTRQEFLDQLAEQEAAINNSDLSELMRRRALVRANGTGPLRDAAAQSTARSQWLSNRVIEIRQSQGLSRSAANAVALQEAAGLDATHVLDIVAGGDPSDVSGLQNRSVNRSLGSQWRNKVSVLDDAFASQARQGAVKAHVRLKPC